MKLYEVNAAIQELLLMLEPDPERSAILEYLAKVVLDTRAGVDALKNEERRLKERRQALERKDERLMQILDRECAGQKTDCGVATICYRKTTRVEVSDNQSAITWLKENGYDSCYKQPAPEVSKSEVKKLLQAGTDVPGIALIQDLSCSLR